MMLKKSITKTAPVLAESLESYSVLNGAIKAQLAVVIQADPENTDIVYIGNTDSQDFGLSAASGITLFVIDTDEIVIKGNGSDSVNVLVSA